VHRRIFSQDLEQSSAASGHHHHSAGSAGFSISQNSLEQLFSRLGQDLQPSSFVSGKANSTCLAFFFHAPASHSSLISFFFANVLSFSFRGNLPHLRATPMRQGLFS
jgi:hypothetical protein